VAALIGFGVLLVGTWREQGWAGLRPYLLWLVFGLIAWAVITILHRAAIAQQSGLSSENSELAAGNSDRNTT
jgi:hypothetical protein